MPTSSYNNTSNKKRKPSAQGQLTFTFDKLDPEEPVMLICGHLVLYKYVSEYGYGWCSICGCKKSQLHHIIAPKKAKKQKSRKKK